MKKQVQFRRRFKVSEWDLIEKIYEIVTLPVSARGDGLCLYLPKDLCDLHGIIAGDRIKTLLNEHYRKERTEE